MRDPFLWLFLVLFRFLFVRTHKHNQPTTLLIKSIFPLFFLFFFFRDVFFGVGCVGVWVCVFPMLAGLKWWRGGYQISSRCV